jgi:hypothetical protein
MADLLGEDFGLVQSDKLYRCLDKLVAHKEALFSFLRQRWQALFDVRFEVLLYDLTSTYFECDVPETGKRKFGYSRDKRSDCVPVVIALIVTVVGTPKRRLSKLEKEFLQLPWEAVRDAVEVKLLDQAGELYGLARSAGRADKERSMRRRRLKKLLKRLRELQGQTLTRDQLLLKLGAAKKEAGRAYGLVDIRLPDKDQAVTPETFCFALNRRKLRTARRREGSYLLRCNLPGDDPALLWQHYIQLTEVDIYQPYNLCKSDFRRHHAISNGYRAWPAATASA